MVHRFKSCRGHHKRIVAAPPADSRYNHQPHPPRTVTAAAFTTTNRSKRVWCFIAATMSYPGRGRASSRLGGGGGGGGGGGNGGRGSGSGRGHGRGRGRSEAPSVQDLDADFEKYHSEAMQIN